MVLSGVPSALAPGAIDQSKPQRLSAMAKKPCAERSIRAKLALKAISARLASGWACWSGASRSRIWRHASSVAIAYRSVDDDAAVGMALATLSLADSATWHAESGTPKARAATWQTLVCSPCPISVPPCEMSSVPAIKRQSGGNQEVIRRQSRGNRVPPCEMSSVPSV